jgi:acetylglutamate kinase
MRVLKIGGHELDEAAFVRQLAAMLKTLKEPAVLVHGGGKEVDRLQQRLGMQPAKVDGMRRTDEAALSAVLMALCGLVSSRLTAALVAAGVDALGMSGLDGGLLRCRRLRRRSADLGFVGKIVAVRVELLHRLLAAGVTPVISPVSLGQDGRIYNVNADQAAAALALALPAQSLEFISNVPGVLLGGRVLPRLTAAEARDLIAKGQVRDGMIPKLEAALCALKSGIAVVRIADLQGMGGGGGTTLISRTVSHPAIRRGAA